MAGWCFPRCFGFAGDARDDLYLPLSHRGIDLNEAIICMFRMFQHFYSLFFRAAYPLDTLTIPLAHAVSNYICRYLQIYIDTPRPRCILRV